MLDRDLAKLHQVICDDIRS
ncbi:hypothetical protein [Parabacteroides gordonii]|nr:hypothetical protein [Parabacteroides gordonii]